jgi:hypothetical protein
VIDQSQRRIRRHPTLFDAVIGRSLTIMTDHDSCLGHFVITLSRHQRRDWSITNDRDRSRFMFGALYHSAQIRHSDASQNSYLTEQWLISLSRKGGYLPAEYGYSGCYVMRGFVTVTVRHRHRHRDVTRLDQTVDTTPNTHIPHNPCFDSLVRPHEMPSRRGDSENAVFAARTTSDLS